MELYISLPLLHPHFFHWGHKVVTCNLHRSFSFLSLYAAEGQHICSAAKFSLTCRAKRLIWLQPQSFAILPSWPQQTFPTTFSWPWSLKYQNKRKNFDRCHCNSRKSLVHVPEGRLGTGVHPSWQFYLHIWVGYTGLSQCVPLQC